MADLWQGQRDDYHLRSTERDIAGQPRMILGADFVRSHHLLFATSQRRLYFSYLGGAVFRAPAAASGVPASTTKATAGG